MWSSKSDWGFLENFLVVTQIKSIRQIGVIWQRKESQEEEKVNMFGKLQVVVSAVMKSF